MTSPNKVSRLLTANETPTNHVTVGKYIKYLCNALEETFERECFPLLQIRYIVKSGFDEESKNHSCPLSYSF